MLGLAFACATAGLALRAYHLGRFAWTGAVPGRRAIRVAGGGLAAGFVALVALFP